MPLDWSQCPAVESVPGKVSGAWVFRGTRMPVSIVFENLEDGMTIDEVMEQFPVTREQVRPCLNSRLGVWIPPLWLIARCLYCWITARHAGSHGRFQGTP